MLSLVLSLQSLTQEYFEQKVDHYDYQNYQKFMQPYYFTEQYYQAGNPLILFLGDYSLCAQNPPHKLELLSKNMAAALVMIQPRAESPDLNITQQQILEDMRAFIRYIRMVRNYRQVIILGANHFGLLAAGIKESFPNYFDASVIIQQENNLNNILAQVSEQNTKFQLVLMQNILVKKNYSHNELQQLIVEQGEPDSVRVKYYCQVFQGISDEFKQMCEQQGHRSEQKDIYTKNVTEVRGQTGKGQIGNFEHTYQVKEAKCNAGDESGVIDLMNVDEIAAELKQWLQMKDAIFGQQN
ncbi:Serine_carboxypeptidase [Hexamita inflata]|uniref:Serine carboxypeptidase n=1 Tax=Hexamita inflata TaxID=28002 RepID=A0AA86Q6W5_9EUKA|nr:Serine carboxypeptidase [Hexamita inflata]